MTSPRPLCPGSAPVRAAFFAAALFSAPCAFAQTTFSIDFGGPSKAMLDGCGGVPITEGDILMPLPGLPAPGPLPPPCLVLSGGFGPPGPGLGLLMHPPCIGTPPGIPCAVEVDALSWGMDGPAMPAMPPGSYFFSVDEFAMGILGTPVPPTVWSEGPGVGVFEAAADAFTDIGLPAAPVPPGLIMGSVAVIDGDGLPGISGFAYPGLGLIEPNIPGLPPDTGDNVDALDVDGPIMALGAFFSLDGAFVCPTTGIPGTGSALAHGFMPGDVLLTAIPGGPPVLYAPAPALGLDLLAGPGSDDLDAVAVFENGAPGYAPSFVPFDWLGGGTDMLLFSVRCGSAVIGAPDSMFGAPIEAGDILTTPLAGGASPFPAIFISAESLGLATMRGGFGPGDELDALDVVRMPLFDCNGNGVEDALDIYMGGAPDCNGNGVIDTCEGAPPVTYCTAKKNSCGAAPALSLTGCPSASNPGAGFGGSAFTIAGSGARFGKSGLVIYTASGRRVPAAPFQCAPAGGPCGFLCLLAPIKRTIVFTETGASVPPPQLCDGTFALDMNAFAAGNLGGSPAPYLTVPGTVVDVQIWGRDTLANGAYLSDAGEYVVLP